MQFPTIAVVLLASLVSAAPAPQATTTPDPQSFTLLPFCAVRPVFFPPSSNTTTNTLQLTCYTVSLPSGGACAMNILDAASNTACLCASVPFTQAVESCNADMCDQADIDTATAWSTTTCGYAPAPLSS